MQARICSLYEGRCNHASRVPKSFLSLPVKLRDEVYFHAGFIDGRNVRLRLRNGVLLFSHEHYRMPTTTEFYLTFCRARNGCGIPLLWDIDCGGDDGVEIYLTLRVASCEVNKDAVRYLCTHNILLFEKVDLSGPFFKILGRAPINLLQWVRRCTVIFSISNKKWDLSLYETYRPAWSKLISLLASSADISKLEVNIACDVGDTDAAHLTVKALANLQPAKCTVRLSDRRNRELERLARSAVHSVTRVETDPSGYFRFLDLPTELRHHVLGFTDLVTPFRQVEWCPRFGYSLWYSFQDQERERSTPCSHFCSKHYAVFPECDCWKTPTRLFLVCRTMLHDARALFFASNRFIISPSDEFTNPFYYRKPMLSSREEPFEASSFLREKVPREALTYLRDLEILFPGIQYNFCSTQGTYLTEWEDTIRLVAPYLKRLTLRIYLGVGRSYWSQTQVETERLQESLARLCQAHVWIVRPLRQLRCLDGLFIRTWSPYDHYFWNQVRVEQYFQRHEKRLETIVMGITYDSRMHRKKDRHVSRWREIYREDLEDRQSEWPPHRGQSRVLSFIP